MIFSPRLSQWYAWLSWCYCAAAAAAATAMSPEWPSKRTEAATHNKCNTSAWARCAAVLKSIYYLFSSPSAYDGSGRDMSLTQRSILWESRANRSTSMTLFTHSNLADRGQYSARDRGAKRAAHVLKLVLERYSLWNESVFPLSIVLGTDNIGSEITWKWFD